MKAVLLLAGKGRRIMSNRTEKHKSLIMLDEHPLLYYLLEKIVKVGIRDVVIVIGYNGQEVLKAIESWNFQLNYEICWNNEYETTNNLYSLYQAKENLQNEDFVTINGDMVFDTRILEGILHCSGSSIAIDDRTHKEPIDSPGIIVKEEKIIDLGRHIPFENNYGYAIGVYKFSKDITKDFFDEAKLFLEKDINSGFHDPLVPLFSKYNIKPYSTALYLWTDIDCIEDVEKAKNYLIKINKGERFEE